MEEQPIKKITRADKRERKIERQILWIIAFLAFLVILYFAASALFRQINSVYYEGLRFTKEKYGGNPIYHNYYFVNTSDEKVVQYNLYLLTDPRYNNITISGEKILLQNKVVYVTVDTSYPDNCKDNLAAIVDLLGFLRGNQYYVITGFMNKTYAKENNKQHITCKTSPNWEIIELFGGNKTEIKVDGNCHQIIAGPECHIQDAVEKFKVQSILDMRAAGILT